MTIFEKKPKKTEDITKPIRVPEVVLEKAEKAPPIAPSKAVESPPQAAPSQLDRIEAQLAKVAKRLGA